MQTIRFGVYDADRSLTWDSGELAVDEGANMVVFEHPVTIPAGGMAVALMSGLLVPLVSQSSGPTTFDRMSLPTN